MRRIREWILDEFPEAPTWGQALIFIIGAFVALLVVSIIVGILVTLFWVTGGWIVVPLVLLGGGYTTAWWWFHTHEEGK